MEIEVKGHSGCQIDVVSEEGESVIALFGDLINRQRILYI